MQERKGSREDHTSGKFRKDIKRKKLPPKNRYEAEQEKASISASAKKLRNAHNVEVPEESNIGYRILNFVTVFSALSECVKCKTCGGDVKFRSESIRGLGFKIMVLCSSCTPTVIPSCPYINTAYEINARFFFAMRLLGISLAGAQKFCGLMDLPPPVKQATYDVIMKNIHTAVSSVCELLLRNAVKEEQEETRKDNPCNDDTELTVSGDGTWKKRGFTSLYGVATVIGYFSGKVLDLVVKSSFCPACNYWNKHINTAQYQEWKATHEEHCLANHEGSAGKMEVDAMQKIFMRSVEKYGVKYINYIGDGDSKTYTGIINSNPYGGSKIIKKECVGHVQKRMGSRLRQCKKQNPGIGGRNKLTAKLIDKLSVYYGLAIRRHNTSKDDMKKAIWATFYHYSSTDSQPQYQHCPEGSESWCKWQQAKTKGELCDFSHDYSALPESVLKAIKPIYEDLSKDALLERCVGGYTQNNNESYNNIIWKIAPKTMHSGAITVEIAAYIAACMFNDGVTSLLRIMSIMGISLGPNAHQYVACEDDRRIAQAEVRAQEQTKAARICRRQQNLSNMCISSTAEDLYYGPGIDDSV